MSDNKGGVGHVDSGGDHEVNGDDGNDDVDDDLDLDLDDDNVVVVRDSTATQSNSKPVATNQEARSPQ